MSENALAFHKPDRPRTPTAQSDPSIKIRQSLKAHPYVASTLFLIGFIFSIYMLATHATIYSAQAVLEVSPRLIQLTKPDNNTDEFSLSNGYQEFIRQQMIVLTQHDLLLEALDRLGDKRYQWQDPTETDERTVEKLANDLKIDPVPDTYSFTIALQGAKPDGLADVVNSVVDTYIAVAESDQIYGGEGRLKRAKKYQGQLTTDLQKATNELAQIAHAVGPTAYDAIFNPGILSDMSKDKPDLIQQREQLSTALDNMGTKNPLREATEDQLHQIDVQLAQMTPAPLAEKNRALLLKSQVDNLQKKLDEVNDFLAPFTLQTDHQGLIKPISYARNPGQGKFKKIYIVLYLGATLLLSLGVPYLMDNLIMHVRKVRDLEEILGFPTLCWLPDGRDPRLTDALGGQLKRLAFSIERAHRQHGLNTFLLTSATAGGGTTSLTLELAYELTKLGIKTIAVEANPTGHDKRYPSYSPESPGLIGMISRAKALGNGMKGTRDNDKTDRALIETANGMGWLPTTGQTPEAFKELKSLYDIILLDAPPLLLCPETEHLVGIADATLLVIHAGKAGKSRVLQTVARLEQLSTTSIGTIVNRISAKDQPAYALTTNH